MKWLVSIFLFASMSALQADDMLQQLNSARRALGDGLWNMAAGIASKVGMSSGDNRIREEARLVELEALAGSGRHDEILERTADWNSSGNEGIRYWRAWASFEKGDYPSARHLLAMPFESHEYSLLALRLSARASAVSKDRASADQFYSQADAALTNNPSARLDNLIEWSQALENAGDVSAAQALLAKEIVLGTTGTSGDKARYHAALFSYRHGNESNGRLILENLVKSGTNTIEEVYVPAACTLSEAGFAAGAMNDARKYASNAYARASQPHLVRRAGFAYGFVLLSDEATRAQGREMISSLVRKHPEEPESRTAQLRLADALLASGESDAALNEYEVLQQAYPEHMLDAHVLEGRAHAFSQLNRHAESVGMFARAARVATNAAVRARCVFEQAGELAADSKFDEAAAIYATVTDGALAKEAEFRRADALQRANRTEDAVTTFRGIILTGGPHATESVLRVASLEASRGRLEQAIADYGEIFSKTTKLTNVGLEHKVRALSGRGRALYRAYRFREAERDFAEVSKLKPSRSEEMNFLSVLCMYGDGRDREAYASAKSLVKESAESQLKCDLLFWIAKYESEQNDWMSAIKNFEACATNVHATATRRIESLVRAARCAEALADFPGVVEIVGRIVSNVPASAETTDKKSPVQTSLIAEALLLQGEALKELARFRDAVLVFERAERLEAPDQLRRRIAVSRADCLFAMGADDDKYYLKALEAYRALLRGEMLTPSARLELSFKVARTYEKLRRLDEAAEEYYTNVVLAYWNGISKEDVSQRILFDATARIFFARASFMLSDYYKSRGELRQAVKMLEYPVAARVPSADEAARRIERLKEEGGFK